MNPKGMLIVSKGGRIISFARDNTLQEQRTLLQQLFDHYGSDNGIMAFWCERGISYGFHMMKDSEGLKDVMCAIRQYWSKAPLTIVYDNACHLMAYCHAREWEYFKDTTFLIDCFHQYNHVGCSEAHSMKRFKNSRAMKFQFMNTSVAESGNAGLAKICPSVRGMAADAAYMCILMQLELQNAVKSNALANEACNHLAYPEPPDCESEHDNISDSSESDDD